ncbi:MAG: sigma-54-dependent Fis family transcriptional regulator [Deltaproteobacteria bacterium]|nr:sigma-54-dependent Fis family transcriptional regulator [Deltaproteobacteria bacterium]
MGKLLIVDDDAQLRTSFEKILKLEGYDTITASTGEAGIQAVSIHRPDCVIMDVRLPGMDGLAAFTEIKKIAPRLPVIIMTAFGTTDIAIEATKLGAFDYVLKPFDVASVLSLISQAFQAGRFMQEPVAVGEGPESPTGDAIIGASPAMQNIYKAIGRVAATDATVLIRGESGTGKELVARALYQHSTRADKPFLIINCVAIPETLLESELFGYEKGAFTGAATRRVGKIERANKGSILLDEIGDMPFNIQAKLLRLLEERKIERLGGREPIPVDVRIIAATNRNLEDAVADGRFREDLYYRLNVVSLSLPPLRERKEDIGLLADYFLALHGREMGLPTPGITDAARKVLFDHDWPGNVRELSNAVQKALIFSRGLPLDVSEVGRATGDQAAEGRAIPETLEDMDSAVSRWIRLRLTQADPQDFEAFMDHFAAIILRQALDLSGGNRTRASKLLGLSRPTLLSKIEKYDLKIKTSVS